MKKKKLKPIKTQRMKRSILQGRHLLPNGNFYYLIYREDKTGIFFSDPHTFNCDDVNELLQMINKKTKISMNNSEHMQRHQECAAMKPKKKK